MSAFLSLCRPFCPSVDLFVLNLAFMSFCRPFCPFVNVFVLLSPFLYFCWPLCPFCSPFVSKWAYMSFCWRFFLEFAFNCPSVDFYVILLAFFLSSLLCPFVGFLSVSRHMYFCWPFCPQVGFYVVLLVFFSELAFIPFCWPFCP